MNWADLINDQHTGRVSTTKLWMHVAYAVMTYVVIAQAKTVTWDLFMVYGGIVGGSNLALYWIKGKYGYGKSSEGTDSKLAHHCDNGPPGD